MIDIEKVLEDMMNPDGGILSKAAEDYFIIHYSNNKNKYNSLKDKVNKYLPIISLILFIIITIIIYY